MANNWAIVVGINKYESQALPPLKFAAADALAMGEFLYQKAGFDQTQIFLFGDGKTSGSLRATRMPLRDRLRKLKNEKDVDNLWFFFSGHGGRSSDQKDYLMPIDGNPDDFQETAISTDFVVSCLRACKARNIVLILDMCRNENQDPHQRGIGSNNSSLIELVKEKDGQKGIITLFSCSPGEFSYEISEYKRGAFTLALLEGLEDKTILRDLDRYLERRVKELHEHAGKIRKQVPLVVPEPGSRYDDPILNHYATPNDISNLKDRARNAESDGDFHKALQCWKSVNLQANNAEDRERAMNAIQNLSKGGTINSSIPSDNPSQLHAPINNQQYTAVVVQQNAPRDILLSKWIHTRFEKINSALQISSQTITSPQWLQSKSDFPWLIWYFLMLGHLPIGTIFSFSGQAAWVWVGTLIMIWTVVVFLRWSAEANHIKNPSFLEGWPLHLFCGVYGIWVIGGTCSGFSVVSWFYPWIWIWVWTLGLVGTKPSPAWIWFGISTTPIVGMIASSFKGIGPWWGLAWGFIVLTQFSAIVGIPLLFISKKSIRSTAFRTISICGMAPSIGLFMGGCFGWWLHLSGSGLNF